MRNYQKDKTSPCLLQRPSHHGIRGGISPDAESDVSRNCRTAQYVLREMTSSKGGFYAAQDANSNGEEGKFYTFTLPEILDVLREKQRRRFAEVFDITVQGNAEVFRSVGKKSSELSLNLKETYDGALPSVNSVMAYIFVRLYRITENVRYRALAERQMDFLSALV